MIRVEDVRAAGAAMMLALAAAGAQGAGVKRDVKLDAAGGAGAQAYCAVLDASDFANTAAGLRGMHLLADGAEIAYVTTVSEPERMQTDAARILHLRAEDGGLLFDLQMPAREYTELEFHVARQDFAAAVTVTAADGRRVGEGAIYDLRGEHLAHGTTVELPAMHDAMLHVRLSAPGERLTADDLEGVDVPPARAAQSVYTTVAETAEIHNTAHESIAELDVPAHVPVQRVVFSGADGAGSFARRVRVEAWPAGDADDVESAMGEISATKRTVNGVALDDVQRVVAMTLGANLQTAAHVRVIVENDGEAPIALRKVELQMRQHSVCFDAAGDAKVELDEGGDGSAEVPTAPAQSWEGAGVAVLGAPVAMTAAVCKPAQPKMNWLRRVVWMIGLVGMAAVLGMLVLVTRRR